MRAYSVVCWMWMALGCTPAAGEDGGMAISFEVGSLDGGAADVAEDSPEEPDGGDGTCGESITLSGWGALPATCLPRCSRATGDAYRACGADVSCASAALRADTTPAATVHTYAGIFAVSCGGGPSSYGCVDWQVFSCEDEACPTAYRAWAKCSAGGSCTTERDTLDACIGGSTVYPLCRDELVASCFAAD